MVHREEIKRLAAGAGFDLCGVAPCRHLVQHEAWFGEWLRNGYQSSLGYMERNSEKRFDPRRLVGGALSAVVCAVSARGVWRTLVRHTRAAKNGTGA